MMDKERCDILVFGVGNPLLTDDGIGPKLVEELKGLINDKRICFETSFLGGMEVLEYVSGYNRLVIIDAIKTPGGIIGDVYHLTPGDFRETCHLSSFHDVSFLTALKLGDKLGFSIPKQIDIIAIEIEEDLVFSEDFSPSLAPKYEEILLSCRIFIEGVLSEENSREIIERSSYDT